MIIDAAVRKFGDDIDTDVIIPARYLASRDPAVLGRHCMEPLDPHFAERVRPGDVLRIYVDLERAHFFDPVTHAALA
jgi:3-isopropylmalate/(R)-2-methylmalate dehydratase small subunit